MSISTSKKNIDRKFEGKVLGGQATKSCKIGVGILSLSTTPSEVEKAKKTKPHSSKKFHCIGEPSALRIRRFNFRKVLARHAIPTNLDSFHEFLASASPSVELKAFRTNTCSVRVENYQELSFEPSLLNEIEGKVLGGHVTAPIRRKLHKLQRRNVSPLPF